MADKAELRERIYGWFTNHPWLKLIALILAIILWFYVQGEINRFNY